MHESIFVNLPVKDLQRSVGFFTKLGYKFNPQFTDENATCMILGENLYAMLLVDKYFESFTPGKPVADAKKASEVLLALPHKSRADVDKAVNAAFAAGARRYREPQDHGFMYAWGFEDLDGHVWEHFWMDPKAAAPQGSE
ncbi:MAG TPA: VOC family protein [Candidatus Thermoplasmatota archaeon]|nr:VOC family protein [Candidatus Thermoplasmatota archaeon]